MAPLAPDFPRTTRRGFLRLATASASLGALAELRALPAAATCTAGEASGRFFNATETEILTQIAERMVDSGQAAAPRLRATGTIATIDRTCQQLDPALTRLLPTALQLVEYGPFLFDWTFRRFTQLGDTEKDASLAGWMTSRFELRRLVFKALRNLSSLGYYSQEESWPLIGYAGPLLRSPRPVT
jgi:hypothetical protein